MYNTGGCGGARAGAAGPLAFLAACGRMGLVRGVRAQQVCLGYESMCGRAVVVFGQWGNPS